MTEWNISYYDERLQWHILSLPPPILSKFLRITDLMVEFGPQLKIPYVQEIELNLFRMLMSSGEDVARIYYCSPIENQIVILHSVMIKDGNDSTVSREEELEITKKRRKEVTLKWLH